MHVPFSKTGRPSRQRQRGAALLLFTIMLVLVVLPMVGLCIDGGFAYFARARLISAADAAALAGARSLNIGQDFASQQVSAQNMATLYVKANFPSNIYGAQNISTNAVAAQTADHIVTVTVSASADIPLTFLGIIGYKTVTVNAYAQSSRRDVNVVLTLDRSGSMTGVCGIMKSDAEDFVSRFVNGRDTVGLITFMGNASIDFPSSKQFAPGAVNEIQQLNCGGNTGSAAALSLAQRQIMNVAEPGALNVIVFFTDGVPNGFTANFAVQPGKSCNGVSGSGAPLNTIEGYIADGGGLGSPVPQPISSTNTPDLPGCARGNWTQLSNWFVGIPEVDLFGNSATKSNYQTAVRDGNGNIAFAGQPYSDANSDAVSKNAADDAALKARTAGTFIYTIGLDGDGGVDGKLLERIANDPSSPIYNSGLPTGHYYYSPNAGQLGAAFNAIASEILRLAR